MKIEAIVFDADGTLFNSFEIINEAYRHVAKVHGLVPPTVETVRAQLRNAAPLHEIMATFFPEASLSELLDTNNTYFAENALRVAGYEGLHDILAYLSAKGLRLAILTGGTRKVHDVLKFHDVEKYFSSVVHSERVVRHKPHPEGYRLAMSECGVAAESSVMIGDSPNDILVGKQAGAFATIGITHGNASRADLEAAEADYIIDSLAELPTLIERM